MKKLGLILLATVTVTGLITSQASAWGINHHPAISAAFGASLESPHSATPDLWSNQNHCSRSELKSSCQYWANMAKYTPWWDLYNKPVRAGFALHFIEDAGQPWHASAKNDLANHVAYELFVGTGAIRTAGLAWVASGGCNPQTPSNLADIAVKMDVLMNAAALKIDKVDTPAEWILNLQTTYDCLYQVGSYGKGLTRWIYQ